MQQETGDLSGPLKDKYYLDIVAHIEALGNAALERSFNHILSYTNTSSTPSVLKRAGLHSLRRCHEDKVSYFKRLFQKVVGSNHLPDKFRKIYNLLECTRSSKVIQFELSDVP